MSLTRRATLGLLAAPLIARAAEPLRLRCSLDTAPTHGRNVAIAEFLKQLEAASDGRIKTELFSSGALFADLDVAKALVQGQVEMACPGAWTLTGFIPDADMMQLPALYAQPIEVIHKVIDGRAGQMVADEIEQRLRSRVLGPWLDLGYSNWYTTSKPLADFADLRGLTIRNSGGAGQAWRARFFGAIPNTTAWPNVPLALSQGTFDGLVTTNESCASAKLWDSGLRHALEDHQYVGEYIPMVSDTFWTRMVPADRANMTRLWAAGIGGWRANMAAAQKKARATLQAHGVSFVDPPAAELATIRARMLTQQEALARELKITPALVPIIDRDASLSG